MTMPFCESRSTRISTRIRGHSHSTTRVAIECGQLVVGDGEELLAHQLGHPERLGHVGDGVGRVPGGPLGQPVDTISSTSSGDPLAGAGRHGEVVRAVELLGGPRQLAEHLVGRGEIDLVDHHDGVGGHPLGDEPVARADGRGGVDHQAHHVDPADGARWPWR